MVIHSIPKRLVYQTRVLATLESLALVAGKIFVTGFSFTCFPSRRVELARSL